MCLGLILRWIRYPSQPIFSTFHDPNDPYANQCISDLLMMISLVRCICGHHELLSNDEYEDPYHDLIQCCSCSHYFHKSCVLYEIQHPHDLLGIQ